MTMFTYTQGIPNPPNLPSQDVGNMQINTNSIYGIINVDHWTFGASGASQIDGRHRQVSLSNQSAPVLPSNIGGILYSNSISGNSWPLWVNSSTASPIQIMGGNVASFTQFAANTPYGTPPAGFTQQGGFSFLPGGLILQYGFYGNATNIGTSGTIPFPVSFNNTPFNVQISLLRNDASETIILDNSNLPSTTGFGFKASSSGGRGIYWTAIGN